jgi:hypothetical protein
MYILFKITNLDVLLKSNNYYTVIEDNVNAGFYALFELSYFSKYILLFIILNKKIYILTE